VFILTAHQVDFFVEFLHFFVSGPDLALELFDFVVQNKLEFLQFLNLLSEILNNDPLISKCDISVQYLLSIYLFLSFELLLGVNLLCVVLIFLIQLALLLLFFLLKLAEPL